jgi:hypothetical protein
MGRLAGARQEGMEWLPARTKEKEQKKNTWENESPNPALQAMYV